MNLRPFLLSTAFLWLALPIHAQLSADLRQRIDSVFGYWNRTDAPGCALAIVQDGQIIYKKGYGMADLEHGIPIQPSSVFYAGSVSKQFVAMSILLLEEAGKLSIEDEVHQYIPELPDYDTPITIRHLLHHISGLRDYLSLIELRGRSYLDFMPKQAALDLIFRQKGLNFQPGEQYSYSNTGYLLLATIVERISGKTLRQFARENIFEPLGMSHSFFNDNLYELVNNRAFGYRTGAEGGFEPLFMRFSLVGSGGLYTTVEDLYQWDQNFYHNKLGKQQQSLIEKMQTDGKLNNGTSAGYAFAMTNGTYRGLANIGHTGSLGGYRAYYVRYPAQQFSIILLGNVAELAPTNLARQVADILLDKAFTEAPKSISNMPVPVTPVDIPVTDWKDYQGRYYSEELDVYYQIRQQGQDLFLQMGVQPPVSLSDLIRNGDFKWVLVKNKKNKVIEARMDASGMKNIHFQKVE